MDEKKGRLTAKEQGLIIIGLLCGYRKAGRIRFIWWLLVGFEIKRKIG